MRCLLVCCLPWYVNRFRRGFDQTPKALAVTSQGLPANLSFKHYIRFSCQEFRISVVETVTMVLLWLGWREGKVAAKLPRLEMLEMRKSILHTDQPQQKERSLRQYRKCSSRVTLLPSSVSGWSWTWDRFFPPTQGTQIISTISATAIKTQVDKIQWAPLAVGQEGNWIPERNYIILSKLTTARINQLTHPFPRGLRVKFTMGKIHYMLCLILRLFSLRLLRSSTSQFSIGSLSLSPLNPSGATRRSKSFAESRLCLS